MIEEKKNDKFTLTALLFSITGRCIINPKSDESYKQKAIEEMRDGLLYRYVFKEIPRYYLKEIDILGDGKFDADPILSQYLIDTNPSINKYLSIVEKLDVNDINYYHFLSKIPFDYIKVSKISIDDYKKYYNSFMPILTSKIANSWQKKLKN